MAILSKACRPDNFESHNSLKLSFTNIRGLHLSFVDSGSFLESNSPDILALCDTNLDDAIDSGNFSVRGYLPLIWRDSSTHMHGLTVYVKEGLPFAWDLSLEISMESYLCFLLSLLHSYNMNDNPKNNILLLENTKQKRLTILEYFDAYICHTQCLTSLSSIDCLLCLYERFLFLVYRT